MSTTRNSAAVNPNKAQLDSISVRLESLIALDEDTKKLLSACKTYEEYADVIDDHIYSYSSHTTDTFWKFFGLHNFVPAGVYVRYALDQVYPSYPIIRSMFFETLGRMLVNEMPEEKAEREAIVRENLKNYIKPNGKVTLYRGATSINYKPASAVSYTVSKEKAEWFLKRNQLFGGTDGTVITKDFPLSQILWYTDSRNEQEVIVISPYLKRFINDAMRSHMRDNLRNATKQTA